MRGFLKNHGLSLVMFALFAVFLVGQALAGWSHSREEQRDHHVPEESFSAYLGSGDFFEAMFENWESEFLQMGAFVMLSSFLVQKGSAQSKKPDDAAEEAEELEPKRDSPGPVHRGGLALALYSRSLTIALFSLFLFSFAMHGVAGTKQYNDEQRLHG